MNRTGSASSSGLRSPVQEEDVERRAAEEAAIAAARADVRRGSGSTDTRRAAARYLPLPPTNDAILRAFAERGARPSALPPAATDLRLYTPEALRREIDKLEAKIGARGGPEVEADRVFLGKLQDELVPQETPARIDDVYALPGRKAVDEAIAAERTFLSRHGGALAPFVRAEHERTLGALLVRREILVADERACDGAKPVAASLPPGVHRVDFTADDLVASLKVRTALTPDQERGVRATFERWHRDTCRLTGEDPTVRVSRDHHAEARVDVSARDQEMLRMRLEMLDASRSSSLAALAFLDSAVRGDSVEAAHARVRGARALSDMLQSMPAHPVTPAAPSPRAEAREVDGVAQKIVDQARGAGHAQNTRFRGVDNSKFMMDPSRVTYGPWRRNQGGPRTIEQAKALFEKQTGQKVPEWVKIVADPRVPNDRHAEYIIKKGVVAERPMTGEQLIKEGVTIRLRPDVLDSDEAIVAVLRHETYELENLALALGRGPMTNLDVHERLRPGKLDNFHDQAWDIADLEVLRMRAAPGSPGLAAIEQRRAAFLQNRHRTNHGPAQ